MAISILRLSTQESSMHGLRHITDERKNRVSRLFWLGVVCSSLGVLFLSGYNVYLKWNVDPEIGLRVNQKSMSDLPFPAITICSPVLARDNLVNFTKIVSAHKANRSLDLSAREQSYFAAVSHACIPSAMKLTNAVCTNRSEFNIIKLLDESSLHAHEMMKACTFKDNAFPCRRLFARVLTDNGFCFTYNMMDHHQLFNEGIISPDFDSYKKTGQIGSNITNQWTLENSYRVSKNTTLFFPIRSVKTNILTLITYLNETDTLNNCQMTGKVFPIILHMPNEMPTPFHDELYLEFGRRKMVTLMIKTYRSTEDLRKYKPRKRGCYFEGERMLKFFKSYTKAHCDFECMTNFTLSECGCVKFSMPRTKGTPICDIDQGECYYQAMLNWPKDDENSHRPCNCLDTCTNIRYSVMYSKDSPMSDFTGPSPLGDMKSGTYSHFIIRTRSHAIDEHENFAAYRLQNFVADFGGLMGLFMGCSILSLVELIYFVVSGGFEKIRAKELKFPRKIKVGKKAPVKKSNLQHFKKKFSAKPYQTKLNEEFLRALEQVNLDYFVQKKVSEFNRK